MNFSARNPSRTKERTANLLVTQTTDTPDSGTDAVSVSRNGVLQSSAGTTGHTTTYAYDALGRQTGVTDPRTGTSETHYNSLGQVDFVKDAANNQTSFGYDASTGRRSTVTDAESKVTRYSYTTRGEQYRVWGHNTYPVEYRQGHPDRGGEEGAITHHVHFAP
jgi:YD repeat-containing protein